MVKKPAFAKGHKTERVSISQNLPRADIKIGRSDRTTKYILGAC